MNPHSNIIDVKYFTNKIIGDSRGFFIKYFNSSEVGIPEFKVKEFFTSFSQKGVLRGMHLQTGYSASDRFISVLNGSIFDVIIDLRKESPTFLNIQYLEMSKDKVNSVFVPKGVAHGFQSLIDAQVSYLSSELHIPELDKGIDALSIDIEWPLKNPIRSNRDCTFPTLSDWVSL
jgi:dTDP-4-dehydrorhamnose 3,5-epimerase